VSVLRFDHVSYAYPAVERDAISDVSLVIEPGEFCVVAGL
jgi:ABC-type multidrug transport system fused ATPase/permease subunit